MLDLLLRKSYSDYSNVLLIIRDKNFDDWFSLVLYHIQQAFEKALKSYCYQKGNPSIKSHDVALIYKQAKSLGLQYTITDFTMLETMTLWEAATRYDLIYSEAEVDINKYLREYESLYAEVLNCVDKETYEANVVKILRDLNREDMSVDTVMRYLPTVELQGMELLKAVKEVLHVLES